MKKHLYIFALLVLSFSFPLFAQNASDYFPSALGYKWFYKTTPYDSLNRPVDSLSFVSVDSFAVNRDFKGKPAKFVLGKIGTTQTVLKTPYLDTSYVSLDSVNILNYTGAVPGIDTLSIGFLNAINNWYSVYRLTQTLNSSYTIFTRDTVVSYNGLNTTFTTEVKGKRVADQLTSTGLGNLLCKKFIITFDIKAKIIIITIPLLTINDTVYLAPANYIVRDVRPSSNVDLSSFGQMAFFIPGSRMDILAPPAILDVNHENMLIKYLAGDSLVNVFNSGSGILNWKANVSSGSSWLHLIDSSGSGNGIISFSFTQNTNNFSRVGLINITDSNAWTSPQIITITQGANITSVVDKNKIPLQFNIFQNYPNPFNPNTSIRYSLPFESNVKLIIYNSIGQVVNELVSEVQQSGFHELNFPSSALASGVYFYTIQANSVDGKQFYSATKKMILLK